MKKSEKFRGCDLFNNKLTLETKLCIYSEQSNYKKHTIKLWDE